MMAKTEILIATSTLLDVSTNKCSATTPSDGFEGVTTGGIPEVGRIVLSHCVEGVRHPSITKHKLFIVNGAVRRESAIPNGMRYVQGRCLTKDGGKELYVPS